MMEQGPDGRRMTETNIDFDPVPMPDETNGLTPKQADEILKRLKELDEVLAEDAPKIEKPPKLAVDDVGARTLLEDLKSGGGIEILPLSEDKEEVFTDKFITEAREALERVLSPESDTNNDESPS